MVGAAAFGNGQRVRRAGKPALSSLWLPGVSDPAGAGGDRCGPVTPLSMGLPGEAGENVSMVCAVALRWGFPLCSGMCSGVGFPGSGSESFAPAAPPRFNPSCVRISCVGWAAPQGAGGGDQICTCPWSSQPGGRWPQTEQCQPCGPPERVCLPRGCPGRPLCRRPRAPAGVQVEVGWGLCVPAPQS